MKRTVKVFVISTSRLPGGLPEIAHVLVVKARSIDGFRYAVRARLLDEGYRLRSVSFGPTGLIVYAEEMQ